MPELEGSPIEESTSKMDAILAANDGLLAGAGYCEHQDDFEPDAANNVSNNKNSEQQQNQFASSIFCTRFLLAA